MPDIKRPHWVQSCCCRESMSMADAMARVGATEARMFDHSEISLLLQELASRKSPSIREQEYRSRLQSQCPSLRILA